VWRFFFEIYGGGPTIIVRYPAQDKSKENYSSLKVDARSLLITDMSQLRSNISLDEPKNYARKGKYFSSTQEKPVMNENVLKMALKERRVFENQAFEKIHSQYDFASHS
jgi:hypothetical protein